jgi:hypothetical protein
MGMTGLVLTFIQPSNILLVTHAPHPPTHKSLECSESLCETRHDDILINLYKIIPQAGVGWGLETCLLILAESDFPVSGDGRESVEPGVGIHQDFYD